MRLPQEAKVELIASILRLLQTQHYSELAGGIPRQQPGTSAAIPPYFIALAIIKFEWLTYHFRSKRAQTLPLSRKQIAKAIILRIRRGRVGRELYRSEVRLNESKDCHGHHSEDGYSQHNF